MTSKRQFTVKFKISPTNLFEHILSKIGISKYENGYFHQVGYSGNQKDNKPDIAIIEKIDGTVITLPNNSREYKLLY